MHCVQLSTGNLVVCHLGDKHQVCIVDTSGHTIQTYGGTKKLGVRVSHPRHLALDIHDNVLVVDKCHTRIQLLSPTLAYLGDIVMPKHQLNKLCTLHFDELNHYLDRKRHV